LAVEWEILDSCSEVYLPVYPYWDLFAAYFFIQEIDRKGRALSLVIIKSYYCGVFRRKLTSKRVTLVA
jgi:hypothetical protein